MNKTEIIKNEDYYKAKCNHQAMIFKDFQKQYDDLKMKNKEQQRELEKLRKNKKSQSLQIEKNIFEENARCFYEIMGQAIKKKLFHDFQKNTKVSIDYEIIEYQIVQLLAERSINENKLKNLMRSWARMGLIFAREDGRYLIPYTKNGTTVSSIRVSKNAIDYLKECLTYA